MTRFDEPSFDTDAGPVDAAAAMAGTTVQLSSIVGALTIVATLAQASTHEPLSSLRAENAHFARATAEVMLDGRLDDLAWAGAYPVTRFFEVYPANVGPPPARTEARFLYDDEYVYVGLRAYDPEPAAIRAPFVKRDHVGSDQDFAEVFIDPMNTRRNALVFRANARGVAADAQFSEDTQAQNPLPDFDFDVRTSLDAGGWSAEFRIPLITLRYETGDAQAWAFMIVRGYPRDDNVRISSAPIPRGANCQLCFAAPVDGISLSKASVAPGVMPQLAYHRNEIATAGTREANERLRAGFDMRWQPRPDSTVDLTVSPDFSQVEADAVQLTANARFALFVPEKRPFFLEGVDLLSTPIPAIHTRSLTDPEFGARVTHRGESFDFTALAVRDVGGGIVIEPGPITSQLAAQDFESTAFVGRYQASFGPTSLALLSTARVNDDGSSNLVLGTDAVWPLSSSDRILAQWLWSQTQNPDRPDLLPGWTGQDLQGAAGALRWDHQQERWYSNLSYERFEHGFRAWNGFQPQVGISRLQAGGGLNFYPPDSLFLRLTPLVYYTVTEEIGAGPVDRNLTAGVELLGPRNALLSATWAQDREPTPAGLESLSSVTLIFQMSPAAWIPSVTLSATHGEGIDLVTGERGERTALNTTMRLRPFERLEIDAALARQELKACSSGSPSRRLLVDTAAQAMVTWHFSSRLYAQALYQQASTVRADAALSPAGEQRARGDFSSLLLSLQTNWRTRFFVGLNRGSSDAGASSTQTEMFAKFTYALALDDSKPLFAFNRPAAARASGTDVR